MDKLNSELLEEIKDFKEVGYKFLNGEMNKADFKKASGGMGVYAHRSGKEFMIRLRIMSGIASKEQLKLVYDFANKYDLEGIHLTTRQAIQLHGLDIDGICEVMVEALENGIYTRGAGGSFPRNVAISPLSGVDIDEAFDVTPYAMAVNKHFMKKITSYKLPRKLKVAFSSSDKDASHATVTDQGFLAVKVDGKEYFKVYIGGGLGRNPKLGVEFGELIEPKDILYHVEAITNLFMAEGDYKNHGKARIRYILDRMGKDDFIKCYKKHLEEVKKAENLPLDLEMKDLTKEGNEITINNKRIIAQKQKGLYSVYFHPVGGQLKLSVLKTLIDEIENMDDVEIRLTMEEGLYIRNLNGEEAEKIVSITDGLGGETRLEQSVACIGTPICQMGVLNGQKTLNEMIDMFRAEGIKEDLLPRVHISGCPNSCGVHEVGNIGFCGKMKRVGDGPENVFELHIKGEIGEGKTRIGDYYGDILQDKVPEFLLELAKAVKLNGTEFKDFITESEDEFKQVLNKFLV